MGAKSKRNSKNQGNANNSAGKQFEQKSQQQPKLLEESKIINSKQNQLKEKNQEKKEHQNNGLVKSSKNDEAQSFFGQQFSKICRMIMSRWISNYISGNESQTFNRRKFEKPIETLKFVNMDNFGYTNQVLVQESSSELSFYVPIYITCKIKNIQQVEVHSLEATVNCVVLFNVYYGNLPNFLIDQLENSIVVQMNRGEAFKLEDDGIVIKLKKDQKLKFLIFTVRKLFTSEIQEDTYYSPFEKLNLIISFTFNSVSIGKGKLIKKSEAEKLQDYDASKSYKVSFNCMRNSDKIPLGFNSDCNYGAYDLCQNHLEAYYTNIAVFGEIKEKFYEYVKNINNSQKSAGKKQAKKQENEENWVTRFINYLQSFAKYKVPIPEKRIERQLSLMKPEGAAEKKKNSLKYFQYTHFIFPLYKHPENALLTIFIPIFLLAVLSTAIFFQDHNLQSRLASIATLTLGFIALIPSIKDQLPESQKLTLVQIIVYIETFSCFFCLIETFLAMFGQNYEWYHNPPLMLALLTHIVCFGIVILLYTLHKFKWEPGYNLVKATGENRPQKNRQLWNNPYCDQIFLAFNEKQEKNKVKPYENTKAKQDKGSEIKISKLVSLVSL